MTILGSIYTGLSGLIGFSKGLDTISDNVANMNTPGFKGSNVHFEDLFYKHHTSNSSNFSSSQSQIGSGVSVSSTTLNFNQGELRQTGSSADAAVNGNGYFILENDGELFYTRAGMFDYDADGYLILKSNGNRVKGVDSANNLVDISISSFRTNPPVATSKLNFSSNLSTGSSTHRLDNQVIYDSTGEQQKINIIFTNNNTVTPRSWIVELQDTSNNTIGSGEIRFQSDGSPEIGYNAFSFIYTSLNGSTSNIELNFGEPGTLSSSTSFSGGTTSTLAVAKTDGYGLGSLTNVEFENDGNIKLTYTNNQTSSIGRIALAHFENQQGLQRLGNGIFKNTLKQDIKIGSGGDSLFGDIIGGNIELSNVELTQQFTDLVIVQRGYQASSQVLTVANEMVQEMLNNTSGKG